MDDDSARRSVFLATTLFQRLAIILSLAAAPAELATFLARHRRVRAHHAGLPTVVGAIARYLMGGTPPWRLDRAGHGHGVHNRDCARKRPILLRVDVFPSRMAMSTTIRLLQLDQSN